MSFSKILFIFIIAQYIFGCVEKTTYSGKIIDKEKLNISILNKDELLEKFGYPSYIDDISNKYFYFTEKVKEKNFYNKKIEYSYLFIFDISENDKILDLEVVNLLTEKNHKYKKIQTENNIVKRGMLESIFGGIGANQMPNSP